MKRAGTAAGFTIVELLIVVVVIAILAAITIVAYTGIQNRTYDSIVQNELATFFKKMEAEKTKSTSDRYPTPSGSPAMSTLMASSEVQMKFTVSAYSTTVVNNVAYCFASDGSEIGIVAMAKSGNAFFISTSSKTVKPYTPAWTSAATTTCKNDTPELSVIKGSGTPGNVWARTSTGWYYGV